jgi:hypothetical protein
MWGYVDGRLILCTGRLEYCTKARATKRSPLCGFHHHPALLVVPGERYRVCYRIPQEREGQHTVCTVEHRSTRLA